MRRIVITGLGAVTPVGHTVKEAWGNILEGKSGIALIDHFDTSGFASRIGGSVRNFDLSPYLSPKEARRNDPFIHYGMAAAIQAIEDSGLEVTDANAERIGIAIGSGIGAHGLSEQAQVKHPGFFRANARTRNDLRVGDSLGSCLG